MDNQAKVDKDFKFSTFQNKIRNLRIYQHISPENNGNTHYYSALIKWRHLNKSPTFMTFSNSSFSLVKTLPLLVHNKKKLFNLFVDTIGQCNSESLQPILDILVNFAYDLGRDFCTNINILLISLFNLTNSLESKYLHLIFDCLNSLFKILSSFLYVNASLIINLYSEFFQRILSSYIINIASDGLSYYLRILSKKNTRLMVDLLIHGLTDLNVQSICVVISKTIRNVKNTLDSNFYIIFDILLNNLINSSIDNSILGKNESNIIHKSIKSLINDIILTLFQNISIDVKTDIMDFLIQYITNLFHNSKEFNDKLFSIIIDFLHLFVYPIPNEFLPLLYLEYMCCSFRSFVFLANKFSLTLTTHSCFEGLMQLIQYFHSNYLNFFNENIYFLVESIINCQLENKNEYEFEILSKFLSNIVDLDNYELNKYILINWITIYPPKLDSTAYLSSISIIFKYLKKCSSFNSNSLTYFGTESETIIDNLNMRNFPYSFLNEIYRLFEKSFQSEFRTSLHDHMLFIILIISIKMFTDHTINMYFHYSIIEYSLKNYLFLLSIEGENANILFLSVHVGLLNFEEFSYQILTPNQLISLFITHPFNPCCLSILYYYLKYNLKFPNLSNLISIESLNQVYPLLQLNIGSPYHKIRYLSLLIFQQYELFIIKNCKDYAPIVSHCLEVERAHVTLLNYKERLVTLRKLSANINLQDKIPKYFQEIPLRFLFSQFFINFSPLWIGVFEIIRGYISNSYQDTFLKIFSEEIGHHNENRNKQFSLMILHSNSNKYFEQFYTEFYNNYYHQVTDVTIDYPNYKYLLWKCVSEKFNDLDSSITFLIPYFISHLENSNIYFTSSEKKLYIHCTDEWQITDHYPQLLSESNKDSDIFMIIFRLLSNSLTFQKGYQSQILNEIFLHLICNKNTYIQKLSLECLINNGFNHIDPFRNTLSSLIENDEAYNSLIELETIIQNLNATMKTEYKFKFISIVTRILYGIILRIHLNKNFYSQIKFVFHIFSLYNEDEISMLIKLIVKPFDYFSAYSLGDYHDMFQATTSIYLQYKSFLKLLNLVVTTLYFNLGYVHINTILRVLIHISSNCNVLIDKLASSKSPISYLKSIRNLAICCINDLHTFVFKPLMLIWTHPILKSIVIPYLGLCKSYYNKDNEPLLDLIHHWSSDPQFILAFSLSIKIDDIKYVNLFHLLFASLFSSNILVNPSEKLLDIVSSIVYYLINTNDSENVKIITPFLESILEFLKKRLLNRSIYLISQSEKEISLLSLLSHIESLPLNSTNSIIECFFIILHKINNRQEDVTFIDTILTVINNLLQYSNENKSIINRILLLFSFIKSMSSREILISIISELLSNHNELADIVYHLKVINCLNKESLNLDYDNMIYNKLLDVQIFLINLSNDHFVLKLFLYNCVFFIFSDFDFTIKNHFLLIIKNVIHQNNIELIICWILPNVKLGLKSKIDSIRFYSIQILSILTTKSNSNANISYLKVLQNNNLEVDFFENIVHIQLHRRTNAVQLVNRLASAKLFPLNILTSILLPIITSFFLTILSNSEHNLIKASIEFIGIVAKLLPWKKYYCLLKLYMKKLPSVLIKNYPSDMKLTIRIIIIIINNFHFDISSSNTTQLSNKNLYYTAFSDRHIMRRIVPNTNIFFRVSNDIYPVLFSYLSSDFNFNYQSNYNSATKNLSIYFNQYFISISTCLISLLLFTPTDYFESQFHQLIIKVCSMLKSQHFGERQLSRTSLISIINKAGYKYIKVIISEMNLQLKYNYHHILIYSINKILQSLSENMKEGELDDSAELLIEIINSDLFHRNNIVSNNNKANKTKEHKDGIYNYILFYLSMHTSAVKFKDIFIDVQDKFLACDITTIIELQTSLNYLCRGLLLNKSKNYLYILELFFYNFNRIMYSSICTNPNSYFGYIGSNPVTNDILSFTPIINDLNYSKVAHCKKNLFIEFYLFLFLRLFQSKEKFYTFKRVLIGFLDSLIPSLISFLFFNNLAIVSTSINLLIKAIQLNLHSIYANITDTVQALITLLAKYHKLPLKYDDKQCIVSCIMKIFNHILLKFKRSQLSSLQITLLVHVLERKIITNDIGKIFFKLVKILVSGHLIEKNRLTSLIQQLCKLSLNSYSEVIRKRSRHIIFLYLMEYKLKVNSLKYYIDYYVNNLQYAEVLGRSSAIKMVWIFISKFPNQIIKDFGIYFFVPLVILKLNELHYYNFTTLIIKSLKELFNRLTLIQLSYIHSLISQWMTGNKSFRHILGIMSLNYFIECKPFIFKESLNELIPNLSKYITNYKAYVINRHSLNKSILYESLLMTYSLKCFSSIIQVHELRSCLVLNEWIIIQRVLRGTLKICYLLPVKIRISLLTFTNVFLKYFDFNRKSKCSSSNGEILSFPKDLVTLLHKHSIFSDIFTSLNSLWTLNNICRVEYDYIISNLIIILEIYLLIFVSKDEKVISLLKSSLRIVLQCQKEMKPLSKTSVIKRRNIYEYLLQCLKKMDGNIIKMLLKKFSKIFYYETLLQSRIPRFINMQRNSYLKELEKYSQKGIQLICCKVGSINYEKTLIELRKKSFLNMKRKKTRSIVLSPHYSKIISLRKNGKCFLEVLKNSTISLK